jgi:hypothetical protein
MSCPVTGPGVFCRFHKPLLTVRPGQGDASDLTLDWAQAADGDQDFVIRASSGSLFRDAPMSYIKGDFPQPAPTKRLPNGEPDYSETPHVLFSCDRPSDVRIPARRGEPVTITCTVTSYLGFSARMDMICAAATGLSCTANPPRVTPPPNGSVQTVYTVVFPENYNVWSGTIRIYPYRDSIYSEPSYIDYAFSTPPEH